MTSPADLIAPLPAAKYDGTGVRATLNAALADDAVVHICAPFGDLAGRDFHDQIYVQLGVDVLARMRQMS